MAKTIINLAGKKFGKLLVKKLDSKDRFGKLVWLCECDCGKIKKVVGASLRYGHTKSCGCFDPQRLNYKEAGRRKILRNYINKAKERNLEWSINNETIFKFFENPCSICGIVGYSVSKSYNVVHNGDYRYNGIDRIDNLKGYTIDNIQTMCYICNRAKNNLSELEFQTWLNRIRNNK